MGTEFEKTSGARVSVPAPLNRKEFNWGGAKNLLGGRKRDLGYGLRLEK